MIDLKQFFPEVKEGKALDVGTRLGEFAVRLNDIMPKGSVVYGIDTVEKAVNQAKEKYPGSEYEFCVMDGHKMDFSDDSFELVAISNTLHHIEDYESVLGEMKRVLKPGGYFVVNEMFSDRQNPAQEVHVAQHTFEAELDTILGSEFHAPTYSRAEIESIFNKIGLSDVSFIEFFEDEIYDKKLAEKNAKLLDAVEKIKDKPEYEMMKKKAETIQEMYKKDGIKRCTQLLCIGRKA